MYMGTKLAPRFVAGCGPWSCVLGSSMKEMEKKTMLR